MRPDTGRHLGRHHRRAGPAPPIYRKTAAYGHFGRELPEFTWEHTDRAEDLRKTCRLA
ncbi:hypothetical protein [Eggerthella sp.]|uniref:hypothetical protein n=1 Tax=Eggerthella sp. TaxID=1929886 RepID=UPI0037C10A65